MTRAERRKKMRQVQKEIMQNELHPAKVNMTRSERRSESWRLAKERVRNE